MKKDDVVLIMDLPCGLSESFADEYEIGVIEHEIRVIENSYTEDSIYVTHMNRHTGGEISLYYYISSLIKIGTL
jgi:hypothetical protein